MKRGQVSFEYLILVGFVTMLIAGILVIAIYYTDRAQDQNRLSQVDKFSNKIISTAEYIFYAGEPSKTTVSVYLPDGVDSVEILENGIVVSVHTSTGLNTISYNSNVAITGVNGSNELSHIQGLKKIEIVARTNDVTIGMAGWIHAGKLQLSY